MSLFVLTIAVCQGQLFSNYYTRFEPRNLVSKDGKYIRDDSGRYEPDDSGRYIPDYRGRYYHIHSKALLLFFIKLLSVILLVCFLTHVDPWVIIVPQEKNKSLYETI